MYHKHRILASFMPDMSMPYFSDFLVANQMAISNLTLAIYDNKFVLISSQKTQRSLNYSWVCWHSEKTTFLMVIRRNDQIEALNFKLIHAYLAIVWFKFAAIKIIFYSLFHDFLSILFPMNPPFLAATLFDWERMKINTFSNDDKASFW